MATRSRVMNNVRSPRGQRGGMKRKLIHVRRNVILVVVFREQARILDVVGVFLDSVVFDFFIIQPVPYAVVLVIPTIDIIVIRFVFIVAFAVAVNAVHLDAVGHDDRPVPVTAAAVLNSLLFCGVSQPKQEIFWLLPFMMIKSMILILK